MKERSDSSTSPLPEAAEERIDPALRPRRFDEYIGQQRVKGRLRTAVTAARQRGGPLSHVLLSGPPGLGKTTLAQLIANELGVQLHTTSGPAIEKKGDLAGILSGMNSGDVLFIDEIHRLSSTIEENLYPAMEDFHIDLVLGEGAHARSIRYSLPPFTLVGATTRSGLLTHPLRDRFVIQEHLEYYEWDELAEIVQRAAKLLDIIVDDAAASELARRSRGTPRIANRLLRRVRDYMDVERVELIDVELVRYALTQLDIDDRGFDRMDRAYLDALVVKFGGGPAGLSTIAAAVSEMPDTLEDVYEPYLLQQGFIQRTPRGRVATALAFRHLDRRLPDAPGTTGDLFTPREGGGDE